MKVKYRVVTKDNYTEWKSVINELWPMSEEETKELFEELISGGKEIAIGAFLDQLVGVVHVSIRTDYVNGSESSPVGYIEGIVVTKNMRKHGIASQLLKEAEKFALSKGCKEMGSDIELDNTDSLTFHEKNGYIEQERVICLTKKI